MAATIFILVVTISVITSLFLFKDVSQFVLESLQDKADISVYFKEDSREEEILRVKDKIEDVPEVKSVNYVSKDKAFAEFTLRHSEDPLLMEALEEVGMNPFLASLNIKAFEASQYVSLVDFLEGSSFSGLIEKVDYYERKPVIERIFSLTSGLYWLGIGFSLLLVIIAFLVAFNTIRLTIYSCREEVKIQRLVGASNWFIRGPFIVQGVLCGLFAGISSFFLFFLFSWLLGSKAEVLFSGLNLFVFFVSNIGWILLLQLVSGIGLGVVSSLIAVRRYLEV